MIQLTLTVFLALAPDIPEWWLDRTALLESSNNDRAVGDGGRSRGRYQIQKRTWERYSRRPWVRFAHNPIVARRVCRLILTDCVRACHKRGWPATFSNARYFYRHGGF